MYKVLFETEGGFVTDANGNILGKPKNTKDTKNKDK